MTRTEGQGGEGRERREGRKGEVRREEGEVGREMRERRERGGRGGEEVVTLILTKNMKCTSNHKLMFQPVHSQSNNIQYTQYYILAPQCGMDVL